MKSELIRQVVRQKLCIAEHLLAHLPKETAQEFRNIGMTVYDSIGEYLHDSASEPSVKERNNTIREVKID